MLLDYCLYRTRLLLDLAPLSDVDYNWDLSHPTCPTSLGAPLHPSRVPAFFIFIIIVFPILSYRIGFCSLCTNDILLSHRLIHLVLFHPPAVFSGNRFAVGGRSFILLTVVLLVDFVVCVV